MEICLTNLSFLNKDFDTFVHQANKIGLKNLEIAPFVLDKKPFKKNNIKKYKNILAKKKLKIKSIQSTFYPYNEILSDKNLKKYLLKLFQFAKDLNVKNISLGTTPYRKCNSKNLEKINFKFFKQILIFAKKYKIYVSVEPVSNKYGNKFLTTHEEVLSLLKKFKNPYLKILFDFGNFYENSTLKELKIFFKKNIKKINHVHLSNKKITTFNLSYIKKNLKLLRKLNYKKSITIEVIDKSGNKISNFKKSNVWNTR